MSIDTHEAQFVEVLKTCPQARNSDITLVIEVWKRFYPQRVNGTSILLSDLYELPREDNAKRIRAAHAHEAMERLEAGKPRGDEHYFLPTDEKIARQRQYNIEVWRKALGYGPHQKLPLQTEQLPRPVGELGFSFMGTTPRGEHFIFSGANNKEYNVYVSIFRAASTCECESYKWGGKHTCKHTKEAIKFLNARAAQELAAHQKNLF